jgi:hypothetical protein
MAEIDTSGAVRTAEEAVQRAYQYTGFEEIKSVPKTAAAEMASLTVIENDSTPFLYTQINGRQVWKVQLKDVRLVLPRKPQEYLQQCKPKTFEAWIDAETGILLRVFSRYDGYDPNLFPELAPDSATKVMNRMREIFAGFPTELPKVDFLEALDLAPGTSPCKAKEIIARYVLWSHMGKSAVPAWFILVRGKPPFNTLSKPGHYIPEFFRNRWCAIVDATTGRFLGAGTPIPAAIPDSVREAVKAKAMEENKR